MYVFVLYSEDLGVRVCQAHDVESTVRLIQEKEATAGLPESQILHAEHWESPEEADARFAHLMAIGDTELIEELQLEDPLEEDEEEPAQGEVLLPSEDTGEEPDISRLRTIARMMNVAWRHLVVEWAVMRPGRQKQVVGAIASSMRDAHKRLVEVTNKS